MPYMWAKGYQVLSSYLTFRIISAQVHVLPQIFSKIKPPPWSLRKLLTINAIYVWERLPSPLILSNTLNHVSPNACIATYFLKLSHLPDHFGSCPPKMQYMWEICYQVLSSYLTLWIISAQISPGRYVCFLTTWYLRKF